jgi:hypothetical protein
MHQGHAFMVLCFVLVCMCDGVSTSVREKSMRNTSIYFDYNDDDDHDL